MQKHKSEADEAFVRIEYRVISTEAPRLEAPLRVYAIMIAMLSYQTNQRHRSRVPKAHRLANICINHQCPSCVEAFGEQTL